MDALAVHPDHGRDGPLLSRDPRTPHSLSLTKRGGPWKKLVTGLELDSLTLLELRIAALSAGGPVGVLRHEHSGTALRTVLPTPSELPALDLEVILLGDPDLLWFWLLVGHLSSPTPFSQLASPPSSRRVSQRVSRRASRRVSPPASRLASRRTSLPLEQLPVPWSRPSSRP